MKTRLVERTTLKVGDAIIVSDVICFVAIIRNNTMHLADGTGKLFKKGYTQEKGLFPFPYGMGGKVDIPEEGEYIYIS